MSKETHGYGGKHPNYNDRKVNNDIINLDDLSQKDSWKVIAFSHEYALNCALGKHREKNLYLKKFRNKE